MCVDLEDHPPPRQGETKQGLVDRGSSVVHEDVDAATEAGDGVRHDRLPGRPVREVRDDRHDLATMNGERLRDLPQAPRQRGVLVKSPRRDGDISAMSRELFSDGSAYAPARTGDQSATASKALQVSRQRPS